MRTSIGPPPTCGGESAPLSRDSSASAGAIGVSCRARVRARSSSESGEIPAGRESTGFELGDQGSSTPYSAAGGTSNEERSGNDSPRSTTRTAYARAISRTVAGSDCGDPRSVFTECTSPWLRAKSAPDGGNRK